MGINEEFLNWCEGKWENEFKAQRLFSKLSNEDIDFLKGQYEARLKADMVAVFDKIRAEIEEHAKINQNLNTDRAKALCWCLDLIDKYKADRSDEESKTISLNETDFENMLFEEFDIVVAGKELTDDFLRKLDHEVGISEGYFKRVKDEFDRR